MGEPAVPTPAERRFRRELARDCVNAVRNDLASPPLVAAYETIKSAKNHPDPEAIGKAITVSLEGIDTELFGIAQELTMTRDEIEKVAREMIDEDKPTSHCATFGRRLLFVLGVTP